MGELRALEQAPLEWRASIQVPKDAIVPSEALKKLFPGLVSAKLRVRLVDKTVNANKWSLDDKGLNEVMDAVNKDGLQLRLDHSTDAHKVVGRVYKAERLGDEVWGDALVQSANPDVMVPILSGFINGVSIKGDAKTVLCRECGKAKCAHVSAAVVISGLKLKEASIVTEPAYTNSKFTVMDFAASVDKMLKDVKTMPDGDTPAAAPAPAPVTVTASATPAPTPAPVPAPAPALPEFKTVEEFAAAYKDAPFLKGYTLVKEAELTRMGAMPFKGEEEEAPVCEECGVELAEDGTCPECAKAAPPPAPKAKGGKCKSSTKATGQFAGRAESPSNIDRAANHENATARTENPFEEFMAKARQGMGFQG